MLRSSSNKFQKVHYSILAVCTNFNMEAFHNDLIDAVVRGDYECIKMMLNDPKLNSMCGSQSDDAEMVEMLHSSHTVNGYSAVHMASFCGHHECLALLLAALPESAAFTKKDTGYCQFVEDNCDRWCFNSAIYVASANNHSICAEYLLKYHQYGQQFLEHVDTHELELCACNDHCTCKCHCNVIDKMNSDMWTPLYVACGCGHTRVVELLLKYGADMTLKNREGNTPLYAATFHGHADCVNLLLKYHRDVEDMTTMINNCYVDNVQVSAMTLARMKHFEDCALILEQFMSSLPVRVITHEIRQNNMDMKDNEMELSFEKPFIHVIKQSVTTNDSLERMGSYVESDVDSPENCNHKNNFDKIDLSESTNNKVVNDDSINSQTLNNNRTHQELGHMNDTEHEIESFIPTKSYVPPRFSVKLSKTLSLTTNEPLTNILNEYASDRCNGIPRRKLSLNKSLTETALVACENTTTSL